MSENDLGSKISVAPFEGGCACGAVRYVSQADPIFMANCHCRDCQKASGSAYAPIVVTDRSSVTITGDLIGHMTISAGGNEVTRSSCAKCGSLLFGWVEKNPGFIVIVASSLDDPEWFQPAFNLWTNSKPGWSYLDPALPTFEGQPPESNPIYDGYRRDEAGHAA